MSQFNRYLEIVQEDRNYLLNEMNDLSEEQKKKEAYKFLVDLTGISLVAGIPFGIIFSIFLEIIIALTPTVNQDSLDILRKEVENKIIYNQDIDKKIRHDVSDLMQNIEYRRSSGMTESEAISAIKDIKEILNNKNMTEKQKAEQIIENNKSLLEKGIELFKTLPAKMNQYFNDLKSKKFFSNNKKTN